MLLSLCGFAAAIFYFKYPIDVFVYKNFMQLACTAMVFSTLLSIFLYLKSRKVPNSALNLHGNSGKICVVDAVVIVFHYSDTCQHNIIYDKV